MRGRPHIEAVALLAAHGFTFTPADRATLNRRRPAMADAIRYAILTDNPHAKPVAFPDIDALARHIHRGRGQRTIEFVDVEDLELQGDREPRPGITVYALDAGNDRDELIGHAYLDGRGQDALRAALRRNRPAAEDQREAA